MSDNNTASNKHTLTELGFSPYFRSQLTLSDLELLQPMRIVEVQRDRLTALGENCANALTPVSPASIGDFAIGDWVLADDTHRVVRKLTPKSSLSRRAAGTNTAVQYIANNVDTLFIVSSCNADFNEARLERYLALSREAEVSPVILLTKADLSDQVVQLQTTAQSLMSQLTVLPLNATDSNVGNVLEPWCGVGQTVALVGSSGVGKTTILNALTNGTSTTQGIREDDAKGKHTTTFRAMQPITGGGWVIDTPGMRALRLQDNADGITAVFEDIIQTAVDCRYTDCRHECEPGCAVQTAISNGELSEDRLNRWRKLQREDQHNTQSVADARKREKQFSKAVKQVMKGKRRR